MDRPSAIRYRVTALWQLAVLSLALAALPATAAPPIELVEQSAGAELPWDDSPACSDCVCEGSCVAGGHRAICTGRCSGRDACCPTVEEVTEERSCWNVNCEKVCVPAIRWPWEAGGSKLTLFSWLRKRHDTCHCGDCVTCAEAGHCVAGPTSDNCLPKCGAVRCVRVLESETYEVTTCRCKWEIRRLPGCCEPECCTEGDGNSLPAEPAGVLPVPAPE